MPLPGRPPDASWGSLSDSVSAVLESLEEKVSSRHCQGGQETDEIPSGAPHNQEHRGKPHIAPITASPNWLHFTSVAPSMRRAKS